MRCCITHNNYKVVNTYDCFVGGTGATVLKPKAINLQLVACCYFVFVSNAVSFRHSKVSPLFSS